MKNFNDIYDAKQMMCHMMDDAYSKGYQRGFTDKDESDKAYQKGLNDAWECARKIYSLSAGAIINIFGGCSTWVNYSASEAITKIKEYEEKKKADDEIKVGDEVVHDTGLIAVVTRVHGEKHIALVYDDGSCNNDVLKERVKKTGRHFDIQDIFDQMKGE